MDVHLEGRQPIGDLASDPPQAEHACPAAACFAGKGIFAVSPVARPRRSSQLSASTSRRDWASHIAIARSATSSERTSGVFVTQIPRSLAAAMSIAS